MVPCNYCSCNLSLSLALQYHESTPASQYLCDTMPPRCIACSACIVCAGALCSGTTPALPFLSLPPFLLFRPRLVNALRQQQTPRRHAQGSLTQETYPCNTHVAHEGVFVCSPLSDNQLPHLSPQPARRSSPSLPPPGGFPNDRRNSIPFGRSSLAPPPPPHTHDVEPLCPEEWLCLWPGTIQNPPMRKEEKVTQVLQQNILGKTRLGKPNSGLCQSICLQPAAPCLSSGRPS